jgi:lysophospholipase L1-like esterase
MKKVLCMTWVILLALSANAQNFNDWIGLHVYAKANKELPPPAKGEKRVVFIGNSITEYWVKEHPQFFTENNYVGRGIGGQTSPQMLSRFRQDVINLKPVAVVINAGTNDIAENTGTYDTDFTLENIKSMAELAQAHGMMVILSSVLPASGFPWRKEIKDAPLKIAALNAGIKEYAASNGFAYIDYYSTMRDESRAMMKTYSNEGVHPNIEGYKVMEELSKKVIDQVLQ